MGRSISSTYGYGIHVPEATDEIDVTKFADYLSEHVTEEKDEYYDFTHTNVDWYEVFEAVSRKYGLTFDTGYLEDYSEGGVLFTSGRSSVGSLITRLDDPPVSPAEDELELLRAAARDLGIEFDPGWYIVVSYG